jgi:hypothetical protein
MTIVTFHRLQPRYMGSRTVVVSEMYSSSLSCSSCSSSMITFFHFDMFLSSFVVFIMSSVVKIYEL